MSQRRTPYHSQPDRAFWKRAISERQRAEIDPVAGFSLRIDRTTRVVTAGSCFAQHIAARLRRKGFNYFVTEPPHPALIPEISAEFSLGTFSARYGNIYTSRQLLQLMLRAYGEFQPIEDAWIESDGTIIDPFRPNIQPGGFSSSREYEVSRVQHFAAVRRAFEELDVFVFTFGLTECWRHRLDGAVFPLAPGVAGGTYDPARHALINLGVEDVVADMRQFLDRLRAVNPASRILLTVSPVPLIATAEPQHVLCATTYSKSVLRVAAEVLAREVPDTHYFPAYEIVTGAFSRGAYFAPDLREVTEAGVDHVMRLFFKHAAKPRAGRSDQPRHQAGKKRPSADVVEQIVEAICDENLIQTAIENGTQ